MKNAHCLIAAALILILVAAGGCPKAKKANEPGGAVASAVELTPKQQLGKKIFFDKNLSVPAGQACAECHSPDAGFSNPETTIPVSRGANLDRFGGRNDLTAAYAAYAPDFHYDEAKKQYVGGNFWDGRAANAVEQAKGPFLNKLEMNNPDAASVVEKIKGSEYAALFEQVFGAGSFDDPAKAYDKVAEAIADYEKSAEVSAFSCKFDLYLAGKVELTEKELAGLKLFEDGTRTRCSECHPTKAGADGTPPLLTDWTYHNVGAPKNAEIPYYYLPADLNPDGVNHIDLGLGGVVKKAEENGKFRVPTLRNVAKTTPYLHNGIFKTLREVVAFYSTRDVGPWPAPEVAENLEKEDLGNLKLTQDEIDALVAFLETLTDGYVP